MLGRREIRVERVSVKGPELPREECERLGLDRHVGDRLTEAVKGELRVLPGRVLHVPVCQIWQSGHVDTLAQRRARTA